MKTTTAIASFGALLFLTGTVYGVLLPRIEGRTALAMLYVIAGGLILNVACVRWHDAIEESYAAAYADQEVEDHL